MSFDATRAAWAARRAGGLEGGPRLAVALAMADLTYADTGELVAGTRGLADLCGVSQTTVVAAQRELEAAGIVERTERGIGTRPSRWRWVLAPPPTGATHPVDNDDQRATSGALANHDRSAKPPQRASTGALARQHRSNYQDQVYPRVSADPDAPVDTGEIPARVAALRDALGGRGRDGEHRVVTDPVAPSLDGWAEDDDARPFSLDRPERYDVAATP
jgi:hypothetical protein